MSKDRRDPPTLAQLNPYLFFVFFGLAMQHVYSKAKYFRDPKLDLVQGLLMQGQKHNELKAYHEMKPADQVMTTISTSRVLK